MELCSSKERCLNHKLVYIAIVNHLPNLTLKNFLTSNGFLVLCNIKCFFCSAADVSVPLEFSVNAFNNDSLTLC